MTTIIFAGAVEFVIGARPRHSVEDLIGAIPPLWLAIWYFAGGILVTRLPTPGGTAPPPNHLRHLMVGFSLLATLTSLLMILSAGLIFLPYLCLTLAAPGAFVRIAGFMQRLPRPVLAPYFQMAFLFPSLSIATPVLISVFNPSPEFLIASIGALAIIAAVLLIASLFSGESHATAKRLSLLAILAVFLTLMITASWLFKTSAQEERTMILATHVLFAVWTIPFFLVAYFAVAASVRKHIPRSVFNPYSYPLSDS